MPVLRAGSSTSSQCAITRVKRSSGRASAASASRARMVSCTSVSTRAMAAQLGALARCRHRGHRFRVHERGGAVELVERVDELVEPRRARRALAGPRREAHAVSEPAGEREHVDHALVAELVERDVDGGVELGEIGAHVVAPEQLVGHRAPAVEQLVGQLAPQHHPVGDALARVGFGERVEAAHPDGREQEQRALLGPVDHEGVAARGARRGQGGDGIGELAVPRQRGVGDRRQRIDRGRTLRRIRGTSAVEPADHVEQVALLGEVDRDQRRAAAARRPCTGRGVRGGARS